MVVECLNMVTHFASPNEDTDEATILKETAQEASDVQTIIKTEVEVGVDSDVQPNHKKHFEEGLDAQPNSKKAAQEELNATKRIKTGANVNSDAQPKSKVEEESKLQQKSKTSAQDGFCKKQAIEMKHSSHIDTFKNQLNELIKLEVNLSESFQLCLAIANKQVC